MHRSGWWLAGATCACFLIVGVPYWALPYARVSLPDALMGPGLLAVGVAAAALCALGAARPGRALVVLGATVPAVVLGRVVVETATDPTSHNLWPLEVVIALVVGLVATVPGVAAGALVARVSRSSGSNATRGRR